MNAFKIIKISSRLYIGFSIFALSYVAILSLINPQATMDLVGTTLPNTDALSSIRGVYGGVGIVITIQLIYLLAKDLHKGLFFLIIFWGAYAISRLITMWVDGPLGEFGSQWLVVESALCFLAIMLFLFFSKFRKNEFGIAYPKTYRTDEANIEST